MEFTEYTPARGSRENGNGRNASPRNPDDRISMHERENLDFGAQKKRIPYRELLQMCSKFSGRNIRDLSDVTVQDLGPIENWLQHEHIRMRVAGGRY